MSVVSPNSVNRIVGGPIIVTAAHSNRIDREAKGEEGPESFSAGTQSARSSQSICCAGGGAAAVVGTPDSCNPDSLAEPAFAIIPAALLIPLFLVFRDPHRVVPSVAHGVFSPVDGKVIAVEQVAHSATGFPAQRIVIKVNSLGSYTARSPVEGTIKDLKEKALWLQTDEGEDIVLRFRGFRLGLAPRALVGFGARLGQGQRCAYLRLTRTAEVELPAARKCWLRRVRRSSPVPM